MFNPSNFWGSFHNSREKVGAYFVESSVIEQRL